MTGGNDLQMQPTTQEGQLWKNACEAAEARATRLADMNERLINETHASWMAARTDADGWHRAVEAVLTIAGLSPAVGAVEAVQALREELERRVLTHFPATPNQNAREIVGAVIGAIVKDVVRPGVPEVRECSALADELRAYADKLVPLVGGDMGRVHRLEQAIRWCRPRLSKDVYRSALDRMVPLPPAEPIADEPKIVQSGEVGR